MGEYDVTQLLRKDSSIQTVSVGKINSTDDDVETFGMKKVVNYSPPPYNRFINKIIVSNR